MMRMHTPAPQTRSSPAGLTRGSIFLRNKVFAKGMDYRVKPGNDGERLEFVHLSNIQK
jgi:hypothetical protein